MTSSCPSDLRVTSVTSFSPTEMVRVTVPVQVNGHNLIYFVYVLTIEGVLEGYSTKAHGIRPNCVNGVRHK